MAAKPEAPTAETIIVVAHDPSWPAEFLHLASALRGALGSVAMRIDHIGSTAVPGLAAKPVTDLQISVASFEPDAPFRVPLEQLGYGFRADNPELTKRYFREPSGARRTHVHVRQHGSWNEQFALLFRDYLRAQPDVAERYVELKVHLARQFNQPHQRQAYVEAKDPFIWATMQVADEWAKETGWQPGPTDA